MVLEYVAGAGILGLLVAGYKARQVLREEEGSKKMIEISSAIREGAMAYLKKQYSILAIFVLIVALFIFLPQGLNQPSTAVSFILGAFLSVLSGFIGMYIATRANVRTTNAARKGLNEALKISFSAGLVMAFFASSVGLLGIVLLYSVFGSPESIFGFAFGASSVALFARVGGGIFTKAADVGADLVGKLEKHIPEDDPRNPAVIADNVGDNVGDVAGMGADLFESYVGSIIAAMAIGLVVYTNTMNGLLFPLVLVSVGLIASLIGTFIVRVDKSQNVTSSFQRGLLLASILVAVGSYFVVTDFFGEKNLFYVVITGLATGLLIGMNTDRYTSDLSKYTRSIVEAAKTGVAPTILQGFVVGMKSTKNTLLIIGLAILVSFVLGGVYGISIAAVAMLSTLGISLAIDAFGPVVDNAGGIAEMSNLPAKVRAVTDKLDAAGNTTAAIGKGFAIGSAALTALALFWAYANQAGLTSINVIDAKILVGLFVGGMLPFYFSALTTQSVGTTAMAMVEEVRRQFKSIKGLMEGKAKPDYKRCIEISTENALREMILPGVLAVAIPVLVGWLFGAATLAGLLVGALITGASLANLLSNSGGAWDNAKKYVEAHKKNTVEWNRIHDATVVGDTVGDPFKDTSGPALNILIKLMTIVSVIALPLFLNPVFVI